MAGPREIQCHCATRDGVPRPVEIAVCCHGQRTRVATFGDSAKKAPKALFIGLALAALRASPDEPAALWSRHTEQAPARTWVATLVQCLKEKIATWWTGTDKKEGVAAKLGVDHLPFELAGSSTAGRFTVRFREDDAFWNAADLKFYRDGCEQVGPALLELAADLEASEPDWTPRIPRPQRWRLSEADVTRLNRVRPDSRPFWAECRSWLHGRLAQCPSLSSALGQSPVARAHVHVATWLKRHGRWNDGAAAASAFDAFKDIAAETGLPLPLLCDLAVELRHGGPLPPQCEGCRAFPLRAAEQTVVIPVPLVEPVVLNAGELQPRAFVGWLQLDKVPVPARPAGEQAGQPIWNGGHVYPAPVLALLDHDASWRRAVRAATQFVNTQLSGDAAAPLRVAPEVGLHRAGSTLTPPPEESAADGPVSRRVRAQAAQAEARIEPSSPTERRSPEPSHDWRWSLLRGDGQPLPPLLVGDHLGAAFALALGKLVALEAFRDLEFRGCAVVGAIDAAGQLTPAAFALALFQAAVATAARTGVLCGLLTSSAWPEDGLARSGSRLPVTRCADVWEMVDTLRPTSAVVHGVRVATRDLEFFAGRAAMEANYQDVPLLREVPLAPVRPSRNTRSGGGAESAQRAEAESFGSEAGRAAALIGEREERLHGGGWTFENQPVDWREVLTQFERHCPQAQSPLPQFVLTGPPGAGKTTFLQFVARQVALAGGAGTSPARAPQALGCRLLNLVPVHVSLVDWERAISQDRAAGNRWERLEAFLARGHPAAIKPAWPTEATWQRWLDTGRVLLLLDDLDGIKADGDFATRLRGWLPQWRGQFPIVLACRTLALIDYRNALAHWPVFGLAKFTPAQRHRFIARYPRHRRRSPGGVWNLRTEELETQLEQDPELRGWAEVPMLLDAMCCAVENGLKLPASRAALCSAVVDRLLERDHPPPLELFAPLNPRHRAEARRILTGVAARWFGADPGRVPLAPAQFEQALEALRPADKSPEHWGACKEDLERWWVGRSGLLRSSRAGYTFLQPQFGACLAAEALAADARLIHPVAPAVRRAEESG